MSKTDRSFTPWRLFIFFVLWLFFPSLLTALADESTDEAKKQLVSQAEDFRKSVKRAPLKTPEKPEIVVEEEKEPAGQAGGPSFFIKEIKL